MKELDMVWQRSSLSSWLGRLSRGKHNRSQTSYANQWAYINVTAVQKRWIESMSRFCSTWNLVYICTSLWIWHPPKWIPIYKYVVAFSIMENVTSLNSELSANAELSMQYATAHDVAKPSTCVVTLVAELTASWTAVWKYSRSILFFLLLLYIA